MTRWMCIHRPAIVKVSTMFFSLISKCPINFVTFTSFHSTWIEYFWLAPSFFHNVGAVPRRSFVFSIKKQTYLFLNKKRTYINIELKVIILNCEKIGNFQASVYFLQISVIWQFFCQCKILAYEPLQKGAIY